MMKKVVALFCTVGLLVLLLVGCSGREDTPILNDSAESYTVSKVKIVAEMVMQFPYLFRIEDTLLGIGFLSDGTFQLYSCAQEDILIYAGGSLTMNILQQDVFGNRFIRRAFPDMEKCFYTVEQEQTADDLSYYLCSYDLSGNRLWETDITDSVKGETVYFYAGAADDEGRLYLSRGGDENYILVYNTGGVLQAKIEMDDRPVMELAAADGKVWCVVQSKKQDTTVDILCWVDPEKKVLQEALELPEGRGNVTLNLSTGETLFFSDYEGIKVYAPDTEEMTGLYTWLDAGITGQDVSAIFSVSEKSLGAFTTSGNAREMLLLRADSENRMADADTNETTDAQIEKIEIVLQGSSDNTELQKAVAAFNLQSDKYKVVIRSYLEDSGRLEAELASGEGPDLLDMRTNNINVYVEKGILEDLMPYLEQSEILFPNQLNQRILELYTIDDTLICIPATFGITTVMGRASELGTEAGWTMEEFRDYVDQHSGATVYRGLTYGQTQYCLVWTSLWASWDKVINYEEKKAYFDSDYFIELLDYAVNYDAIYDSEEYSDVGEQLNEGKLLLLNYTIGDSSDFQRYEEYLNGDMVCIGWPTEEGTPRHGISGYGEYAISAFSENKEGAWEFIEYLVSSQVRGGATKYHTYCYSFPTLNVAFEDMLEYEQNHIVYPAPTDENREAIRDLIENVSYRLELSSPVDTIISEELEACFSGDRSVEETARIIQNRVQLYLDEMM